MIYEPYYDTADDRTTVRITSTSMHAKTLFRGLGELSVCISGLMEWIALVNIRIGDTIYAVPFKFETTYVYE